MSLPSVFPRSIWYCGGDRGPGDRVGCTVESHRTHTHTHTHTHTQSHSHQNNQKRSQQPVRTSLLSDSSSSHDALCPETGRPGRLPGWGVEAMLLLRLIWFPSLGGGQELRTGQIWKQSHTHTHSFTHKQHTPQQRGLPDLTTGREAEAHGSRVCGQGPLRGLVCPFIHPP